MIGERIAIISNAGGGKSTLARRLARVRDLPLTEVDRLLWRPGWEIAPEVEYDALHEPLIAGDRWLIEGMGHLHSVRPRLLRATWIVAVDMPIWMHFWLAAERQIEQALGTLEHPIAGLGEPIPTRDMFETLWQTEQDWMPTIRAAIDEAEAAGVAVSRLAGVEQIDAFAATHAPG